MHHRVILAWAVHAYTALGLVCALLALRALGASDPEAVFFWLVVAFAIDASDGVLARRVRVDLHTPHFSGRKLDDITDYLNYTFVPVCLIGHLGLVPDAAWPVLAFALISSVYGFCSDVAKTDDGYFTGFPSYWNVVAFYLYLLTPPGWLASAIVLMLACMTFWPTRYLYPSKNPIGQRLGLVGGVAWAVVCVGLLWVEQPAPVLVWLSLLYPAWYLGFSFWLHFTQPLGDAAPE
ncbi:MAG: CDP-alcohol phosphatidyltransferase family protein [Gammaproteobacteria bacterium]